MTQKKKWLLPGFLLVCLVAAGLVHGPRLFTPFSHQLVSSKNDTRNLAYIKLEKMELDKKKSLIPDLLAFLKDPDAIKRRFALYALRTIGLKETEVLSGVPPLLLDTDPRVQEEAAVTAMSLIPEICLPLLPYIERTSKKIYTLVVETYQTENEKVLPVFLEALKSSDPEVRRRSALMLGGMSRAGAKAVPELIAALEDPVRSVRFQASVSVMRVNPLKDTRVLPVFWEIFKLHPWSDQAFEAADLVRSFKGVEYINTDLSPILTREANRGSEGFDKGLYSKPAAVRALMALKPPSTTMNGLRFALKQKNPLTRYQAALHIGDLVPPRLEMIPILVGAINDSDPTVRARVVYALSRVGLEETERYHSRLIPGILRSADESGDIFPGYWTVVLRALEPIQPQAQKVASDLLQKGQIKQTTFNRLFPNT